MSWADSSMGRLRTCVGDDAILLFPGARAVLRDEYGQILLIKRRDSRTWAFPAGAMEVGEDLAGCAAREVREETGLTPKSLTPFAMYTGTNYTNTNVYGHTYQLFLTAFLAMTWDGVLQRMTDETIDGQFFLPHALPRETPDTIHETLRDLATFERTGQLVMK